MAVVVVVGEVGGIGVGDGVVARDGSHYRPVAGGGKEARYATSRVSGARTRTEERCIFPGQGSTFNLSPGIPRRSGRVYPVVLEPWLNPLRLRNNLLRSSLKPSANADTNLVCRKSKSRSERESIAIIIS